MINDTHNQFDEINQLILEIASGNFNARRPISDKEDEWDSVIASINMLGEELYYTTVSKNHLDSIYRGIVDMVFILNPDRTIQKVNEFTLKNLGITDQQDIIGKPFQELITDVPIEVLEELMLDLDDRGYNYNTEITFKNVANGIMIPTLSSTSLIKDNTGNSTGLLIIAKDISRQKNIEQKLIDKNKELDTLFYKTSHDLKSPITTILGLANLAKLETADESTLKYLDMIKECVNNLETILDKIRAVREVSRQAEITKDKKEIFFKDYIKPVLKEVQNKYLLNQEDIVIEIDCDQSTPFLGSESMIHTMIYNIIDTAVRSRKQNSRCLIVCQIKESKENFRLSFRDNGIGILEKNQDKVFDMFFKTNNQYESTGLELYTVKNVVQRIDGELSLTSTEGQGTEIQIIIPNKAAAIF